MQDDLFRNHLTLPLPNGDVRVRECPSPDSREEVSSWTQGPVSTSDLTLTSRRCGVQGTLEQLVLRTGKIISVLYDTPGVRPAPMIKVDKSNDILL